MGIGNNLYRRSTGEQGSKLISDTNATTPSTGKEFYSIYVVADTEFTSIVGNMTGTVSGVLFASGSIIYGIFTSIQLASGTVIAYEDKIPSGL